MERSLHPPPILRVDNKVVSYKYAKFPICGVRRKRICHAFVRDSDQKVRGMGKIGEQRGREGPPVRGDHVALPLLNQLPEFCSVLLSGPPGVGKFEFLMEALDRYLEDGQPVVFVCIDVGPGELQAHLRRSGRDPTLVLGRGLSVVDGFTAAVSDEGIEDREGVRVVSSLSNLEGLGMAITEGAANHNRPVKVFVYTISTLFLHNSAPSLSKFFQIVSARVKTQMGTILYASQAGVTEERQDNLLRSLVDGVIDMRFNASLGREVMLHHLRGYRIVPEWIPIREDGYRAGHAAPATVSRYASKGENA